MTDEFQSVGNGTGPNPARQEGPHAHQILTDLDGNHVFGVGLGADKVNVLNLDPGAGAYSERTRCRLHRSRLAPGRGTWPSIPIDRR
jgi:6-phosphogluconolactonase (cycloisomerase 2 family)